MNKYLNYLVAYLLSLAALSSCSDDNEPTPVPVPDPTPSGYCLMFYMSGGDPEHDILLMESARQAAEATGDDVAVTILMKTSGEGEGEAHNGTRRYTAQDGVLTQDTEFGSVDDFAVTDPARLSEFIRWSAEQYQGRRYLLVIGGHGGGFLPSIDLPEEETGTDGPQSRATLLDKGKVMTSSQLGDAIRQSGINLDALILHSCQQGSIEMLADWEGTADYLLGSPFSIPDYAYDYISLVNDLRQERGVEETLQRTVDRTINLWQEFHDEELSGMVVEVTRLRDLTALWDVLRETIDCMHNTMDVVNVTTDLPAVYGETYGQGYLRALFSKYEVDYDDFFQELRVTRAVDIVNFIHSAAIQSGNMRLASYVNRLDEVLKNIVVAHRQTDGKHDYIYNVYTNLSFYSFSQEERESYHKCRFDQLTGWGNFYEGLVDYVFKLHDSGLVLTPMAEHLIGKWEYVSRYVRKADGGWEERDTPGEGYLSLSFRSNGEVVLKTTVEGVSVMDLTNWGDSDDETYTININNTSFKILKLTENELELGLGASGGYCISKILFHRMDDNHKGLAERMVGKWTMTKGYEKKDGEWVEMTENMPEQSWVEYRENGRLYMYTLYPGQEPIYEDFQWMVYEDTGFVLSAVNHQITLEDNDNTLIMAYHDPLDSSGEINPDHKYIFVRN